MADRCIERGLGRWLLPLVVGASGCGIDRKPCFGLRLSEPLSIQVASEYSRDAGYDFRLNADVALAPCPDVLRVPAGKVLSAQVIAQDESRTQSCLPNTVTVTGGLDLSLGEPTAWFTFGTEGPTEIVHATNPVTVDGCTGRWGMSIETRSTSYGEDGDAFLPAPSSGYPPIVMYVGFEVDDRGSAACAQLLGTALRCTDYYVVELNRP